MKYGAYVTPGRSSGFKGRVNRLSGEEREGSKGVPVDFLLLSNVMGRMNKG
jgi:hypothetical protein